MDNAEQVMLEIIHNKIDHAQNFLDDQDYETVTQVHEEIQEFLQVLMDGKIANIPADTKEKKSILFDLIVSRKIFKII